MEAAAVDNAAGRFQPQIRGAKVGNLVATATVDGGHFLLLAGIFQHPKFLHSPDVRSENELREHVEKIFSRYFTIEQAEPALINAAGGEQAMPAVAFWMVRRNLALSSLGAFGARRSGCD